jgi:hypothetical protein
MQAYQWNARDYAASSSVQQQWARELIRKLALKGNESLRDIYSSLKRGGKALLQMDGAAPSRN